MVLNSALYVAFVCVVCIVAYIFPRRARYVWLLLCSYVFYLFPSGVIDPVSGFKGVAYFFGPEGFSKNLPAFGLMLAATFISYICAHGIESSLSKGFKRLWLGVSLAVCLGLLAACKYLNFFLSIGTLFGGSVPGFNLLVPLGISYYTLQTVSYSIDVYNGDIKAEKNPLRYALYVSFFSGIVTGPINRAGKMLPQYKNPARFDYEKVAGGLFRILWGIFKKMVIADNIGRFTAAVLGGNAAAGPQIVLALLLFPYQLYADFGGCCDIAIGTAKMLGFRFAENFERPFAAKTFPLLWQRWHISLTSFFRDYVFTPLVWSRWTEKLPIIGKRVKRPPTFSSVIIIFLLSGLWHGANINYVIWGLLNGVIMALAQLWGKKKERLANKVPLYRAKYFRGTVQRVLVYLMFAGCIVFFAAGLFGRPVTVWFSALGTGWGAGGLMASLNAAGLSAVLMAAVGGCIILTEVVEGLAVKPGRNVSGWIREQYFFVRWPLYFVLLAVLLVFGMFGSSPFIYSVY